MENNRFFQWVWRINGLALLAGVGLTLIVGVSVLSKDLIPYHDSPPAETATSTAEPAASLPSAPKNLALGSFSKQGNVWIAALQSNERPQFGFDSKYENYAYNYQFYQPARREAYWLKATSEQVIARYDALAWPSGSPEPVGFAFEIEESPRKAGLYFADSEGKNLKPLLSGVNSIGQWELLNTQTLLVFYQEKQQRFVAEIDLASGKIVQKTTLLQAKIGAPDGN